MKKGIFESIRCNICGNDGYEILYKDRYGDKKIINEGEIIKKFKSSGDETLVDQVVRCKKCNLVFVNPRIRQEFIIKGYSEGKDENFVSQVKGREATFSKSIKLIDRYYGKNSLKKGKILDIGTAAGSFLHAAKKDGWDVYGIEPNGWLCDWGKKHYRIDIKPGTIFDNRFKSSFFDVVTLWDVLEHTPDPKKVLDECGRLLKKDGLIAINYPDIGSWIAKLLGRRWVFLLSVHLFYFDRKTIRKMLEKEGFDIVLFRPHYQRLALDYLVHRMGAYSRLLSRIGAFLVRLLRMENILVPYWLGQTLVMAKKR